MVLPQETDRDFTLMFQRFVTRLGHNVDCLSFDMEDFEFYMDKRWPTVLTRISRPQAGHF